MTLRSFFTALTCLIIVITLVTIYRHTNTLNEPSTKIRVDVNNKKTLTDWEPNHPTVKCYPNVPCRYPEVVNLRIVVIVYNRWKSLQKILRSLDELQLDGDSAAIEIWIDRNKDGKLDNLTFNVGSTFRWSKGSVRVHVQQEHVGIYGQWIATWRPPLDFDEIGVIFEDDMDVSPYAYRWLKAAYRHYGNWKNVAGITLFGESQLRVSDGGWISPESIDGRSFLYKLIGTWGYAPNPRVWRAFQDWFYQVRNDSSFHPYVEGIIATAWYKQFEKDHYEDSMWEQWFVYYTHVNNLYTVYSNLNPVTGGKGYLIAGRREDGLHGRGIAVDNSAMLLRVWKDEFVKFNNQTRLHGYDFGVEEVMTL